MACACLCRSKARPIRLNLPADQGSEARDRRKAEMNLPVTHDRTDNTALVARSCILMRGPRIPASSKHCQDVTYSTLIRHMFRLSIIVQTVRGREAIARLDAALMCSAASRIFVDLSLSVRGLDSHKTSQCKGSIISNATDENVTILLTGSFEQFAGVLLRRPALLRKVSILACNNKPCRVETDRIRS